MATLNQGESRRCKLVSLRNNTNHTLRCLKSSRATRFFDNKFAKQTVYVDLLGRLSKEQQFGNFGKRRGTINYSSSISHRDVHHPIQVIRHYSTPSLYQNPNWKSHSIGQHTYIQEKVPFARLRARPARPCPVSSYYLHRDECTCN